MHLGFHVRVAGGHAAAVEHAKRGGCTALQVFSMNPKTYRVGVVDRQAVESFARMREDAGIVRCAIHTSYLINLASEDEKIVAGSLRLLQFDLEVAQLGKIHFVNTHLGSYGTRDRAQGQRAVCRALQAALAAIPSGVKLVLENSAGAGQLCGGTLEELGEFIRALDHPQLAVCLDTAHAWAAGYQIDSKDGVDRFLAEVERTIGIERVVMFHLNDTQVPLGGHRDRHWHIGEGNIGLAGFRALAQAPELREKTAILETPGEDADDLRNMQTIRALFSTAAAATA